LRPCFNCAKELLQARVHAVYYLHDWKRPADDLLGQYQLLEQRFPGGVAHIDMEDEDAVWALSSLRADAIK
jgi:dCMP deaminase